MRAGGNDLNRAVRQPDQVRIVECQGFTTFCTTGGIRWLGRSMPLKSKIRSMSRSERWSMFEIHSARRDKPALAP